MSVELHATITLAGPLCLYPIIPICSIELVPAHWRKPSVSKLCSHCHVFEKPVDEAVNT